MVVRADSELKDPELNGSMALLAITGKCGKGVDELESALGEFARRNPEMTDDEGGHNPGSARRDPLGGAIDPEETWNTQD